MRPSIRTFSSFLAGAILGGVLIAFAAPALTQTASTPAKPPLFVNMTTGDTWRGWMGLHFAHATLKQGHPVTVFLNLDAVKLAATDGAQDKKASMKRIPRDILVDFIKDGGTVLMCGPCMREFGLKMEDLVAGVRMGAPGVTQGFIFADGARTLTW
jgi:predicted peroxiredoxin